MLIVSKDRFWWSKKTFHFSYDPYYALVASSQLDCEVIDDLPKLYSHNYIPNVEPAPYESSFTEQQEEEARTMEANVNFEATPSNQLNVSEQVIRNENDFEIK